jgi:4-aminobutyrate aminotransferase-like enzyme
MDRLTEITAHYDMDTVFLSNSGAEAVENAIKIAYDDSGGAKHAITFDGAFHGRTLGALSLNRSKSVYRRDFPEISGVHDVPFCDDRNCTAETCSCGFFADGVSQLRRKLDPDRGHIDPDDVAYLIMEPIQGEGGYRLMLDRLKASSATACSRRWTFGFVITSISCYMGYYTEGGAEGVGKSTTQAAVTSCVMVLVADFVLAATLL